MIKGTNVWRRLERFWRNGERCHDIAQLNNSFADVNSVVFVWLFFVVVLWCNVVFVCCCFVLSVFVVVGWPL